MDIHPSVIAGRYKLRSLIGKGAHGEVWLADDLLLGECVAVKRFNGARADWPRIRQEIATLRRLRLPGVVRLLDEGTDEHGSFIVMERIAGTHFPGRHIQRQGSWDAIADCVIEALEILTKLHAAGVVHRDLKPENILVKDNGEPVFIDFGLSSGNTQQDSIAPHWFVGTPQYAAPEQLRGENIDSRTDLYAFGVLLFEVLAGRPPHEGQTLDELVASRLSDPAPSLGIVAPDVPRRIVEIVDALLAVEPDDRPRTAAHVVHALRNSSMPSQGPSNLSFLGRDKRVADVVRAILRGHSVQLVGERGSGRTRTLHEVAEGLRKYGLRVLWSGPSNRPFSALHPLVTHLDELPSISLDEAFRHAERAVVSAFDEGTVLLVDDAERVDRYSLQVLEKASLSGPVVFALQNERDEERIVFRLEPLSARDLEPLFLGPNRLFHLTTDAARILHERTRGLPARVVSELSEWERSGLARRCGDLLALGRDTLDRLSVGLFENLPTANLKDPEDPMGGALGTLLSWICVAYPLATIGTLAKVMGEPQWRIEAEVNDLVRLRAARMHPDGTIEPLVRGDGTILETERIAMHQALADALADESEAHLRHALAGHDGFSPDDLARLVLVAAERRAESGYLGQAVATLEEGLRVLGLGGDAFDARCAIVRSWALLALRDRTPRSLDRVLCEVAAVDPELKQLADIEPLLRAATAIMAGIDRAGMLIEALQPFADHRFERVRRDLRITAARRMAQDKLDAVFVDNERWAELVNTSDARAAVMVWRGRLHYQRGRFVESAQCFRRAAEMDTDMGARIIALFHAGAAFMEAFQLDEALSCAQEARLLANERRRVYDEARTEWLVRTIGYRHGTLNDADIFLVDAVAEVGVPDLEALVCMTEGAILFRAGDKPGTIRLAERARRLWTSMNKRWAALCARCLALAFGTGKLVEEARALAAEAAVCKVPGLGIQMLGLLAMGFPDERLAWIPIAEELAGLVPREHWAERIDVLSVNEALVAVTGTRGA